MSGSRYDTLDIMKFLLPYGVSVCCMDFSGCGESEGEFVSLGHHEQNDVSQVMQYLKHLGTVTSIGLWGFSMGAATSMFYAATNNDVVACVLDSPYSDFEEVAFEYICTMAPLMPKPFARVGLEVVRRSVLSHAGFDPLKLKPVHSAPKARCPAMFASAEGDVLTRPRHTEVLHQAWGGSTAPLEHFAGDHNSDRPAFFSQAAAKFMCEHLFYGCCGVSQEDVDGTRIYPVEPGGVFDVEARKQIGCSEYGAVRGDGTAGNLWI
jgi:pimeloyl-ACP methyl ester carboxylesterase